MRIGIGISLGSGGNRGGLLATYALDGVLPTLVIDQANNFYYADGVRPLEAFATSGRTTGQTVVDSDGNLKWALHNLCSDCDDLTAWTASNTTTTTTSFTGVAGSSIKYVNTAGVVLAGEENTISFKVSTSDGQFIQILNAGANAYYANFDVANGTAGNTGSGSSSSIVELETGVYLVTLVIDGTATYSQHWRVNIVSSNTAGYSTATTDVGTFNVSNARIYRSDLGGMQLATDGSTYLETGASAIYHAGRAYNASGNAVGIQSYEGRTNLQVYSNDFSNAAWAKTLAVITADAATSPDGTTNADTLTDDGSTGAGTVYVSDGHTISSGVDYVWSIFAKAAQTDEVVVTTAQFDASTLSHFDLGDGSILSQGAAHSDAGVIDYANSWYRDWVVYQTTTDVSGTFRLQLSEAGSATVPLDGTTSIHLWGAQVEAGEFTTPYIPTLGSAVSRGADDIETLLSEFTFNATEGTIVAVARCGTGQPNQPVWALIGAGADYIHSGSRVGGSPAGNYTTWVQVGGSTQANLHSVSTITDGVHFKSVFAYKENDFAQSVDGSTPVTDGAGTLPVVTSLHLGGGAYGQLNGELLYLAYYPARLSNATIETEAGS